MEYGQQASVEECHFDKYHENIKATNSASSISCDNFIESTNIPKE